MKYINKVVFSMKMLFLNDNKWFGIQHSLHEWWCNVGVLCEKDPNTMQMQWIGMPHRS